MSEHEKIPDSPNCDVTNTEAKSPDATCNTATNSDETTPETLTPAETPKKTTSERKWRTNQANALKSTGPKTAQGKAIARRNALKHGMTCEKENLFSTDEKLYKSRLDSWTKVAHPQNDMELYQLESAVRATVNLDRCARNAKAEMNLRTRKAAGHWEGVQTKKINRATKHWTTQPAACVAKLETFTRGVEWLLACWDELTQALEARECWTIGDFWLAMRLMGKCPEMRHENDKEVAAFRTLVVAVLAEIDQDEVDLLFGIDTSPLEPEARTAQFEANLPSREDALEGLWATLDAEVERLAAIRAKLWESKDGPVLSEKIDRASFDDSKNGVLRRRYESANHLDMNRCLKQFTDQRNLRAGRLKEDRVIEDKARAERIAELYPTAKHKLARPHLRNEPKSSDTKDSHISTSGKSAGPRARDFTDPAEFVKWVLGSKEGELASAPPPNPPAPGAGEAQKPS
jgi:hypothetical protein